MLSRCAKAHVLNAITLNVDPEKVVMQKDYLMQRFAKAVLVTKCAGIHLENARIAVLVVPYATLVRITNAALVVFALQPKLFTASTRRDAYIDQ
ncbi:MAG: hypothetical protein QF741_02320 [Candidatus Peribacteraceae bacterium]|jgi:hypothetical protein|nr:hypothetical protein [Candidatus Peribacteraceae bacterium]|tara:strand:- start:79 stop:360 length:282 start_codon:yes stop_codon:yes gene_type:complete